MKIKIIILLAVLLLATNRTAFPQNKNNSVYLELGGNGGLYSVNYDRMIRLSNQFRFAPRIGISWLGKDRFNLPLETNLLWAKNKGAKNFAEVGVGATFIQNADNFIKDFHIKLPNENEKINTTAFITRVGYRHQKPNGGIMYRGAFNLIFNKELNNKVQPFVGFSIGYTF